MKKERLDVLLISRGLAPSREKAKAMIMSGNVYVNGQKEDKAGTCFDCESDIDVKCSKLPFVSRGGLKLQKAMESFDIDINGLICMDIGASTGGFTDCMLQHGAKKVYSVDVGRGQLAWNLRNDERVICMEKTNIRYIKPDDIDDIIEFAGTDVSFISLTKILNPVKLLLKKDALLVCLIKPQFEAGREQVGKHGVVRDKKVHIQVIKSICSFACDEGLIPVRLDYSPVKGPEGNIEYLLCLKNNVSVESNITDEIIESVANQAHSDLQ